MQNELTCLYSVVIKTRSLINSLTIVNVSIGGRKLCNFRRLEAISATQSNLAVTTFEVQHQTWPQQHFQFPFYRNILQSPGQWINPFIYLKGQK
jgi:hypothetical protein